MMILTQGLAATFLLEMAGFSTYRF